MSLTERRARFVYEGARIAAIAACAPFRRDAQKKMAIQGAPLPMGRAVARAVKKAMGYELDAA